MTFTDRWDRTFCLFPWIKLNISDVSRQVLQRRLVLRPCFVRSYVPLPSVGSANVPSLKHQKYSATQYLGQNVHSHRPERIFYEKTPLQSFTAYRSVFYATHRSSAYRRYFSRHRQFSDQYKHAGRLSPERAHGARNSSLHPVFTA